MVGRGGGATSNLRPFEVVGRSENRGYRGGASSNLRYFKGEGNGGGSDGLV